MKILLLFSGFFLDVVKNRTLLWKLAKNDFKSRYASSFLGVAWAFLQPLATLLTMWFVFQVALRNGDQGGYPFIVWFAPAMLVWNYFSEAVNSATGSVAGYSYLVRKVNFRVGILPVVKILSSGFIHLAMLLIVLAFNVAYRVGFSLYNLQIFYYLFCMFCLLLGLGWLLGSISLFAPDVASFVNIVLGVGFWASPICWNPDTFANNIAVLNVLKLLNPMFYIIEGYRDTFLGRMWFWERPFPISLAFWLVTGVVFLLGAFVFNRLRPQFADVL